MAEVNHMHCWHGRAKGKQDICCTCGIVRKDSFGWWTKIATRHGKFDPARKPASQPSTPTDAGGTGNG